MENSQYPVVSLSSELELYAGDKWRVYIDARIDSFLDDASEAITTACSTGTVTHRTLTNTLCSGHHDAPALPHLLLVNDDDGTTTRRVCGRQVSR